MKSIDRLILRELWGPWLFGVGMFSILIVAATYLFRLTGYLVDGAGIGLVIWLTMLTLPGVMVQTFAMAVLLATLLGFGRLSGDSEIVAMKAAGVSVVRMMVPVAGFSLVVAAVAFFCNEMLVPGAAKEMVRLQDQITRRLRPDAMRSTSFPILERGKLRGMLFAEDYNLATGTMRGATIISYGDEKKPTLWLYANVLEYDPKRGIENGWRIRDGATLTWRNGSTIALRDEAWPVGVAAPGPPTGSVASDQIKDPQYWSMRELREQIALAREEGRTSLGRIRDMEYWFWNKLALPLAAFVYGLLGGPLGIRNHRTSTATGFATSIVIIFGYVTVANLMNVYAMGGVIPAYVASFTPIVIGLTAAALAIWRRNL